jgi:glycosyltransferase involved in cell wall biosynthesis
MEPISFILPSRNNLKYLKQAYESIRKNSIVEHEICIADDFSDDGTMEWVLVQMKRDKNIQFHRNHGPTRLGHTILYDTLINDYATHDRVIIFHADMYLCPNTDTEIDRLLERGKVVSLTRIEPPLHPDGPEKILLDYGIEPEEFKEDELLQTVENIQSGKDGILYGPLALNQDTSEGIFAPWAIYKEDFQSIGGHDPLFAPQSKEDSDIFNRFLLNGYQFIQTWKGFVYHMTCRGSRFKDGAVRNPDGQVFMRDRESEEWLTQNMISTRNFIRKWGHFVKHDEMLKPIVPHKYDIGIVVENYCDYTLLKALEPWCNNIFVPDGAYIQEYIKEEQPKTKFPLRRKVHRDRAYPKNGVVVRVNGEMLNQNNFELITKLPEIIEDSGDFGSFELDILKIRITNLQTFEEDLINVKE